ncbi:class I SAM-dependent methyltransferase [Pseudoduganella aquatica]|uniref:Class I SAM-dependent methyltransferase n=1 Tax=Pseudoduganella aquatica TaxID=2660641 RepID=A0A7X4HEY4_9BURK|nr:class I SAM-dependent methyltransferase [Pseudoduganella aquatica]MYN09724.1 hypothetical protein [Pseudoduganella aquatica]
MTPELRQLIDTALQHLPADGGGGCPPEKALAMAEYVVSENINYAVEIGVYKGRSFFPTALAQQSIGGQVIGIDPYLKSSARENDLTPEMKVVVNNIIDAWDTVDSYISNMRRIALWGLGNNAMLLRETSEVAVKYLPDGIGMLHIDGNHDIEFVAKDILYYLPKIKNNGLIIMDDTDWDSVRSCLPLLAAQCKLESEHGTWQVWRKA